MGIENIRQIKEQALLPKEKKRYVIPKISEKKKKQVLLDSEGLKEKSELDKWFNDRKREMIGVCCNCGNPSMKFDANKFHWSIAHILKKSIFKSVSTHKMNWLELCWLCHQTFDSSYENAQKMYCWEEAKRKYLFFKNFIEEKHKDLDWFDNDCVEIY